MTLTVPRPGGTGPLRQRIIAAAAELTAQHGWSAVTMARLAEAVGVSRQTVYNEVGSKPALAQAMVLAELERFLAVVGRAFDEHPDDLLPAIRAAARGVLELAQDNKLLHAVVSATHGADTELLPLLTTHADPLLARVRSLVATRLAPLAPPSGDRELAVTTDMIVRLVLSHVMQPSDLPARTADDIAWVAGRMLAPDGVNGPARPVPPSARRGGSAARRLPRPRP